MAAAGASALTSMLALTSMAESGGESALSASETKASSWNHHLLSLGTRQRVFFNYEKRIR